MAYGIDDVDETTLRPQWADRPRVGDTVQSRTVPELVGVVIATFYRNGEGGMHVTYDHGTSWSSCHGVTVIRRAENGAQHDR